MIPPVLRDAAEALGGAMTGKVSENFPISRLTSFRVGGPAAVFAEPDDARELALVGRVLAEHGLDPLIVGRGTNLLVSDEGFAGVVVRLGKAFDWIASEGTGITAGGATPLPQVANRAAKLSLTGLEFSIAIPATVGGSVRMNAGAHGSSISSVLNSAEICNLERGSVDILSVNALGLEYRTSSLGPKDVVCSATFELQHGDPKEIASGMERYRTHRAETQPAEAPNAGSMFKNPEAATAGYLIESVGLKGLRVGGAEVSNKHANFFLANPGTSAQDIYDLMAHVQRTVLKEKGVLLIPEVKLVGSFDRTAGLRETA